MSQVSNSAPILCRARDPVMVVDSGHTYERNDILAHFARNGAKGLGFRV